MVFYANSYESRSVISSFFKYQSKVFEVCQIVKGQDSVSNLCIYTFLDFYSILSAKGRQDWSGTPYFFMSLNYSSLRSEIFGYRKKGLQSPSFQKKSYFYFYRLRGLSSLRLMKLVFFFFSLFSGYFFFFSDLWFYLVFLIFYLMVLSSLPFILLMGLWFNIMELFLTLERLRDIGLEWSLLRLLSSRSSNLLMIYFPEIFIGDKFI